MPLNLRETSFQPPGGRPAAYLSPPLTSCPAGNTMLLPSGHVLFCSIVFHQPRTPPCAIAEINWSSDDGTYNMIRSRPNSAASTVSVEFATVTAPTRTQYHRDHSSRIQPGHVAERNDMCCMSFDMRKPRPMSGYILMVSILTNDLSKSFTMKCLLFPFLTIV